MNDIALVLGGVVVLLAATLFAGGISWQRLMNRLLADIAADTRATAPAIGRFYTEQVAQLPAPVQRYFAFALSPA